MEGMKIKRKWSPAKFRAALAIQEPRLSCSAFSRLLAHELPDAPSNQYIHKEWFSSTGRGPSTAEQLRAAARLLGVTQGMLFTEEAR